MKVLLLSILISFLVITSVYVETPRQEIWGDIDSQWLWKAFEAKKPFILYSEPSKSSKQIGKVKEGMILYLLDAIDNSWYLLRETAPPYRKGWVSGRSNEDDAVDYKVAPLCITLILPEDAFFSKNPHLYFRKDKMPFITVVTDFIKEVGRVNDRIIELNALGYEDIYFFWDNASSAYAICIGTYETKKEAERLEQEIKQRGHAKDAFLRFIVDESGEVKSEFDIIIAITLKAEDIQRKADLEKWSNQKLIKALSRITLTDNYIKKLYKEFKETIVNPPNPETYTEYSIKNAEESLVKVEKLGRKVHNILLAMSEEDYEKYGWLVGTMRDVLYIDWKHIPYAIKHNPARNIYWYELHTMGVKAAEKEYLNLFRKNRNKKIRKKIGDSDHFFLT